MRYDGDQRAQPGHGLPGHTKRDSVEEVVQSVRANVEPAEGLDKRMLPRPFAVFVFDGPCLLDVTRVFVLVVVVVVGSGDGQLAVVGRQGHLNQGSSLERKKVPDSSFDLVHIEQPV